MATRRGRIVFVASTARRHGTRSVASGRPKKKGRPRGARRVRRGLYVGTHGRRGRIVYGVRRGRFTFLAVTTRRDARKSKALVRRLRVLGLRRRR
ncbi:MAG: hypothetical protein WKF40_05150 [Thermoleophilaceae bacterium]